MTLFFYKTTSVTVVKQTYFILSQLNVKFKFNFWKCPFQWTFLSELK